MTVFNNATHFLNFVTGGVLGSVERLNASDIVIASLRAVGIFSGVTMSATVPAAPASGDKWLDTTTQPAVPKVYDGSAWNLATFSTWFPSNASTLTRGTGLIGQTELTHVSDGVTTVFEDGKKFTADSTAPATPYPGDQWYDTTEGILYQRVYEGVVEFWLDISSAGTVSGGDALPLTGGTLTGNVTSTANISIAGTAALGATTVTGEATATGNITSSTNLIAPMVTVDSGLTPGTLPSAAANTGAITYITGATGGGGADMPVFSDGTNWRKIRNGNIVA